MFGATGTPPLTCAHRVSAQGGCSRHPALTRTSHTPPLWSQLPCTLPRAVKIHTLRISSSSHVHHQQQFPDVSRSRCLCSGAAEQWVWLYKCRFQWILLGEHVELQWQQLSLTAHHSKGQQDSKMMRNYSWKKKKNTPVKYVQLCWENGNMSVINLCTSGEKLSGCPGSGWAVIDPAKKCLQYQTSILATVVRQILCWTNLICQGESHIHKKPILAIHVKTLKKLN